MGEVEKPSASWQERYASKIKTASAAVKSIQPGAKVYVGSACATPLALTSALESLLPWPADVEFIHFLTTGMIKPDEAGKVATRYRHRCFFVGMDMVQLVNDGRAEYVPISLAQATNLIKNNRIPIDVALVQVSPPDEAGFVSLGVSVDINSTVLKHARTIIAEVNPSMPRTMGDTFFPVERIAILVPVDTPVIEYVHAPIDEVAEQIAKYVAEIIEDGATLQVGLGRIPNEAVKYLKSRKGLGIHSDVITDAVLDLVEEKVVTGASKSDRQHRIVTSFCLGTSRLYEKVNNNPLFCFEPIEQVADIKTIARQNKMVSLTQAFSIDLTGQVCADQFNGSFYGGAAVQQEFLRGAALSSGGKPIVCLRATTEDGLESRIRPLLPAGEGTTIARLDVHYVITEFGIAYLFGKSVRERAIALIELAHPKFRPQLLEEAKKLGYVHPEQKVENLRCYLVEEERHLTLKNGRGVAIRPARAGDVDGLKHIFHHMSKQDVYKRFFRHLSQLSFREMQSLCSVNFDTEVAFVAVTGQREAEEVVGTGCYFLNPSTNLAEVAYMIVSDWQGTGLGSALQRRLMEFGKKRGLRGFTAHVLRENLQMLELAKRMEGRVSSHFEEDSYEITVLFDV